CGKPMQLPAPKLPNSAAAAVPGTISPARSTQRQAACTSRVATRLRHPASAARLGGNGSSGGGGRGSATANGSGGSCGAPGSRSPAGVGAVTGAESSAGPGGAEPPGPASGTDRPGQSQLAGQCQPGALRGAVGAQRSALGPAGGLLGPASQPRTVGELCLMGGLQPLALLSASEVFVEHMHESSPGPTGAPGHRVGHRL